MRSLTLFVFSLALASPTRRTMIRIVFVGTWGLMLAMPLHSALWWAQSLLCRERSVAWGHLTIHCKSSVSPDMPFHSIERTCTGCIFGGACEQETCERRNLIGHYGVLFPSCREALLSGPCGLGTALLWNWCIPTWLTLFCPDIDRTCDHARSCLARAWRAPSAWAPFQPRAFSSRKPRGQILPCV